MSGHQQRPVGARADRALGLGFVVLAGAFGRHLYVNRATHPQHARIFFGYLVLQLVVVAAVRATSRV